MERHGVAAQAIRIEVTERALLENPPQVKRILESLRLQGVRISLDDFGTGYSSLSYLRRLPLDIIKIDRSLVTGLEHEEDVAMIARAVISLGQSLRKTVVAEGVENQAQFDFLRYQGCHEFQGYLIARPLPEAELTALLEGGTPPAPSSFQPLA